MDKRINVWTYWHSDELPAVVDACIASWEQHLDSDKFKITVLSEESLPEYFPSGWLDQIPNLQDLCKANQSDFIRLSLLKLHGGIWMDASIYLLQDLSFIQDFETFYAPRIPILDARTVQSYFLVAPSDDYIITEWLNLLILVLKKDCQLRKRWYQVSFYTLKRFDTYFTVYSVYAELYRSDSVFRKNTPKFREYDTKTSIRIGNVVKFFKIAALHKMNMKQRVIDIINGDHVPSVACRQNGELVYHKVNGYDRWFRDILLDGKNGLLQPREDLSFYSWARFDGLGD